GVYARRRRGIGQRQPARLRLRHAEPQRLSLGHRLDSCVEPATSGSRFMTQGAQSQLAMLRVDQVGSLLRPAWLKEVYARHGRGESSDAELRTAQDRAVREAIAIQER